MCVCVCVCVTWSACLPFLLGGVISRRLPVVYPLRRRRAALGRAPGRTGRAS